MNPPSKATEIAKLRALAEELGPDSYVGPWLKEQIAYVEKDVRNDMFPMSTMRGTVHECERLLADAKKVAAEITAAAERQAKAKTDKAVEDASRIRDSLRRNIDEAYRAISSL